MSKPKKRSLLSKGQNPRLLIILLGIFVLCAGCLYFALKSTLGADAKLAILSKSEAEKAVNGKKSTTTPGLSVGECEPTGKSFSLPVKVIDPKTQQGAAGVPVALVTKGKYGIDLNTVPGETRNTDANGNATLKVNVAVCKEKNGRDIYYIFNFARGIIEFEKETMAKSIGVAVIPQDYAKTTIGSPVYSSLQVFPVAKTSSDIAKIKPKTVQLKYSPKTSTSKNTITVKTVKKSTGAVYPNASVRVVVTGAKCTVVCPVSNYKYEIRTGSDGQAVVDLSQTGFVSQTLNYKGGKIKTIEFKDTSGQSLGTYSPGSKAVTLKMN